MAERILITVIVCVLAAVKLLAAGTILTIVLVNVAWLLIVLAAD